MNVKASRGEEEMSNFNISQKIKIYVSIYKLQKSQFHIVSQILYRNKTFYSSAFSAFTTNFK